MRRRRDRFPPDRALQARMAAALLAASASAALLVAVVGWLAVAVQWRLAGFAAEAATPKGGTRARTRPLVPRDERRARELLARLAALGGLRCPRLVFEADDAPLSWTTAVPWRRATIHVTSGLLSGCVTREVDSVLAHELTHIANHDAWVMTMVGPPPSTLGFGPCCERVLTVAPDARPGRPASTSSPRAVTTPIADGSEREPAGESGAS